MADDDGRNLADEIFNDHGDFFARQAGLALATGIALNKVIILAIDEADDDWSPLYELLAKETGASPHNPSKDGYEVAVFVVGPSILPILAQTVPEMAEDLRTDPPKGRFRAMVLCGSHLFMRALEPLFPAPKSSVLN